MNPTNCHCEQCHCELFFLLRSVKQSRRGSVVGFQLHEPYELHEPLEPYELYELNKHSFLATVLTVPVVPQSKSMR